MAVREASGDSSDENPTHAAFRTGLPKREAISHLVNRHIQEAAAREL